jgi:hypothetical protein
MLMLHFSMIETYSSLNQMLMLQMVIVYMCILMLKIHGMIPCYLQQIYHR